MSSQRRGSKPSNFAILLVFLILKTYKKISYSKQADCNLTTSFSDPKSSRDFRETGPWGVVLQIYVYLLRCFCWLFQRLPYRLNRLHWQPQELQQLKIRFLPHFPNHRENTLLTWIIPKEKFRNLTAISVEDGTRFGLFRALDSHKARCLNQWERVLNRNFIIKRKYILRDS